MSQLLEEIKEKLQGQRGVILGVSQSAKNRRGVKEMRCYNEDGVVIAIHYLTPTSSGWVWQQLSDEGERTASLSDKGAAVRI